MTAVAPEKTVICLSCAAKGKEKDCLTCGRIQPVSLRERADAARESYARYWVQKSDLAFAREVAKMRREDEL